MALPIKFRKEDLPTLIAQDLNPCLPKGCRIHVHCKSKPMKKSTWQFKGKRKIKGCIEKARKL